MSSSSSNITAPFSLTCAAVSGWYTVCAWLRQTKLPKMWRESAKGAAEGALTMSGSTEAPDLLKIAT